MFYKEWGFVDNVLQYVGVGLFLNADENRRLLYNDKKEYT